MIFFSNFYNNKSFSTRVWHFKGPGTIFSMQVVTNKCVLQNPEKICANPCSRYQEKRIFKFRKMTSPIRSLGYSNN